MRLFRKSADDPPRWWRLTKRDWEHFRDLVRAEISSRNIPFEEHFEKGYIELGNGAQVGLHNLSMQYARVAQIEREGVVSRFFVKGFAAINPTEADARAALRLSLQPGNFDPENLWLARTKPCESFHCQLMIDTPGAAIGVTKEDLEKWAMSFDQALTIALDNNWKNEPHNVERSRVADMGTITLVHGESMYTGAQVMHIDRFINPTCHFGAIFSVPNRHVFGFIRADEPRLKDLLPVLANFAQGESQYDYPITSDLVWWKDGVFRRIGGVNNDQFEIDLPRELASIISHSQ